LRPKARDRGSENRCTQEIRQPGGQGKKRDLRVTISPTQEENVFADRVLQVDIEEWNYNFGPTHFLLFIRIQSGGVTNAEFGD